jgi:hypothetical protein
MGENRLRPARLHPARRPHPEQIIQKFAARESVFAHARKKLHLPPGRQSRRPLTTTPTSPTANTSRSPTSPSPTTASARSTSSSPRRTPPTRHDDPRRLRRHRAPPALHPHHRRPAPVRRHLPRPPAGRRARHLRLQRRPQGHRKKKRYFQGKVWVDQQDFQIVLVNGKNVPTTSATATKISPRPSPPTTSRSTASSGSPPTPRPRATSTSPILGYGQVQDTPQQSTPPK